MTDFDWPCDRHSAHAAHTIPTGEECDEIGLCADEHDHCPGVKAHPLTQIGKGEVKEVSHPITRQPHAESVPFNWPLELDQKIDTNAPLREGDFILMELPPEFAEPARSYRVVSFDPETRRGVLRLAGS